MPRHTPDTIAKIGLKKYLDDTKEFHRGKNYQDWLDARAVLKNKTEIARLFGVDRGAIDRWIAAEGNQDVSKK